MTKRAPAAAPNHAVAELRRELDAKERLQEEIHTYLQRTTGWWTTIVNIAGPVVGLIAAGFLIYLALDRKINTLTSSQAEQATRIEDTRTGIKDANRSVEKLSDKTDDAFRRLNDRLDTYLFGPRGETPSGGSRAGRER